MRTLVQVVAGLALCAILTGVLLYSNLPIFWEHEGPQPHVYSITWHSWLMLAALVALTQVASFTLVKKLSRTRD